MARCLRMPFKQMMVLVRSPRTGFVAVHTVNGGEGVSSVVYSYESCTPLAHWRDDRDAPPGFTNRP